MLDAAHGGAETGTLLSPQLLEKDLVLTLSVRLRSALTARGIHVVTTRESDTNPPFATRAAEANHAHAAACLVLHATASGSGVHLYTSSLNQTSTPATPAPWATAAAPFLTDSLQLASEISTAFTGAGLPFTLGRVRLDPMDALRCPAAIVEIAPLHPVLGSAGLAGADVSAPISDQVYQVRVVNALAAALVQWCAEHPTERPTESAR